MSKHYGQIVEGLVRRNGYNLSQLAIRMKMNRRTYYNWFTQPYLKPEIILRIGLAIGQDLSVQFPEHFKSDDFKIKMYKVVAEPDNDVWKDKYINLLEKYSLLLRNRVGGS